MSLFSTGAGDANRAAEDAAAARQGRAANLTGFVDSIFSDPRREAGINDFMGALRSQYADNTNRGFADASRQQRFRTARQGLTGGSVDVNRQKLGLQDLFRRRLGNEGQVQDAGQALRTQDLGTRESLINSAYGTADVGQDALHGLIDRQAQNANSVSGLLPRTFSDIAGGLAAGYQQRRQRGVYDAAAGGA